MPGLRYEDVPHWQRLERAQHQHIADYDYSAGILPALPIPEIKQPGVGVIYSGSLSFSLKSSDNEFMQ